MSGQIYDAVVVGGGPVGCATAIALADAGATVAVLEAQGKEQRAPDSRTLALSWNSRIILERLGAWPQTLTATPIEFIHVSHRGQFGRAVLSCADIGLPALGYVVRFADIFEVLHARAVAERIHYRSGFKVSDVGTSEQVRTVTGFTTSGADAVHAHLVVIADGGAALAKATASNIKVRDYAQSAVVGLVRMDRAHGNTAFERFTPEGPIALLPCADEYAFVWTCKPDQVEELLEIDEQVFLSRLRSAFGDRAGRFLSVRLRSAFPLVLRIARERDGVVFLGNAAQTLHPIAGQGFNLGLRDVWDLAELVKSRSAGTTFNAHAADRFRQKRRVDRNGAIALTDGLARTFSNDIGLVSVTRGIGLAALDLLPPMKRALMTRMIFGIGN